MRVRCLDGSGGCGALRRVIARPIDGLASRERSSWERSRWRGIGIAGAVALAFGAASSSVAASAAGAVPNLSGTWTISSVFDNVPASSIYRKGSDTVTFKRTAPNTYTVTVASGGSTSNVVITGPSFTLWSCGASAGGATYSQEDEASCPSNSGHWLEPWHLDFKGAHYTATGTFQAYAADGSTTDLQYGTFTAVGPARTTHHSCGNLSAEVTNLKATDTSCAVARKVATAEAAHKSYGAFKCTAGKVPVSCKDGRERVTYKLGG
jgi:hypothetical protein